MFFKNEELSFEKIKSGKLKYIAKKDFSNKIYENNFESPNDDLVPLDIAEEYRSVLLSKKENVVVKHNLIRGLRRRLYAHLGFQNLSGKYSLIDEFKNLKALSHVDFVPDVYAFGTCKKFPLEKEILIIEYYEDALTADDFVVKYPDKKNTIIESVFNLFLKAWDNGFAHMDPHPKNILFLNDDTLKFIDFECCCLCPEDKEFYMGFSMGYFFHFWFYKYFDDEEYTKQVNEFIKEKCPDLNIRFFNAYFEKFKKYKVSRSLRYKCFKSAKKRAKLIEHFL